MLKGLYILVILFLGISCQLVHAQDSVAAADQIIDPVLIQLKARLLNSDDASPVAYAHVINTRTHGGTTTDSQGYFNLEMLNIDSLSISSIGYLKEYIHIPPKHPEDSLLVIKIDPVRYAIPEVEVQGKAQKVNMQGVPQGKKSNVPVELRGDAYDSKPRWYNAILSPASFLQYKLSRKEKDKRTTRSAIISQKEWERISKYYNRDMVLKLTNIPENQVDSFMIYFNSKSPLTKNSNEYDIREAIISLYKQYRTEKDEDQ